MTYPKILQIISDPVNDNIQKLAALFPSAVKDGELDIDALKQELGEFTEAGPEKYELTWAGKQQAKQIAFEPIVGKTLAFVSEDSKQPDTTENLFIEGDNLEVLKLLRQNYYGAVKLICIDPPYNTGNDFIYNDNFKMSRDESDKAQGDMSDLGERYTKNRKDHNRYHANWMNMMYPRLRVAKDLLREDGVIFIHIDDNEVHNLRKICDEVFGEKNFLSKIIIQSNKRGQTYKEIAKCHEYLLVYYKSDNSSLGELDKKDNSLPFSDKNGPYDLWELRNRNPKFGRHNRPNLYYPIYIDPDSEKENGLFNISLDQSESFSIEVYPKNSAGEDSCWRWGKEKVLKEGIDANPQVLFGRARRDGGWNIYEKSRKSTTKAKSIWADTKVINEQGTVESGRLEMRGILEFPKPIELVKRCIQLASSDGELIIDFFSGSSTTAHAVMQLNFEDKCERKYIMVQLPEPCDENSEAFKAGYKNICEIGKERIRRAGEKILEENKDKDGIENLDIGFKVFRVADTNINWLHQDLKGYDLFDHYDKNASDKDKLDFMPGFTDLDVVYEIMLRQTDIPLSSKVVQLSDIGSRTYMFADSFVVCLEQDITRELVNRLAAIEPLPVKFVFRDSAFDDNIALKDETFRRLNALIEKNSGGENPAYIVEFI